jgi:hypothetical protein
VPKGLCERQLVAIASETAVLEYEVIWGHIDILVVAVRSLSRSEQVKTLLAGPSPISPMKAEITIPYFQHAALLSVYSVDG